MEFSLNEIKSCLLNTNLSEAQIVSILDKISKGFTSERDNIKTYVSDRDFVSAYAYFYLPTNIAKLPFVLDLLPKNFVEGLRESHIIDVGTGPGTFSFAFSEYFEGDVTVTGIDSSALMIEQAKKINEELYKNKSLDFSTNFPNRNENQTLFFGHSVNEMGPEYALELIEKFNPENIIFIEPGTTTVFEQLLKIRKSLATKGYNCFYPCSDINMKCPIELKREEGIEDWCHQVLRTSHDSDVERLSQLIKLDRKVMPLISHVYSRKKPSEVRKFRMIRFFRETKFSFDWEVCFLESEKLVTKKVEVVKKHLSKKQIKHLKAISVGLEFEFEIIKEISSDHLRVKLIGL
jgi:ribosomal protein RSM22 (predicted rRNA methylase)